MIFYIYNKFKYKRTSVYIQINLYYPIGGTNVSFGVFKFKLIEFKQTVTVPYNQMTKMNIKKEGERMHFKYNHKCNLEKEGD